MFRILDAAWTACIVIIFFIISWAIALGIGKLAELFFVYLVLPIHITWPLWFFIFIFLGAIYHEKK